MNYNEVSRLMREKSRIEDEIQLNWDVLRKNNIGMKDPLVDNEDFPRNDIDIYAVRNARHNVICLQNDHKSILNQIEQGLHQIHKDNRNIDPNGTSSSSQIQLLLPFAKIDRVDEGSPAFIDGLKVNDLICKFGGLTHDNFKGLVDIGEVVRHSKEKAVQIVVKRNENVRIILTPREWSGRGLLGCNVIPYEVLDR